MSENISRAQSSSGARLKHFVKPNITDSSYLPFSVTDSQVGKFRHSKHSTQRSSISISLFFTTAYASAAMA
jgi:hypothetical protein